MNEKTFGELIRESRESMDWSQSLLAKKTGLSQATISRIELGKQTNLLEETKNSLLNALEIKSVPAPTRQERPIPVISWVHAGLFSECGDIWPPGVSGEEEAVYSHAKTSANAFALRVEGDSMCPRYMPGDIVIVDPAIRQDNGSACVVWINGEVSLKLFYETEKEIRLVPMNEAYEILVIPKDRKVDFRVIGKVVDMKPKL